MISEDVLEVKVVDTPAPIRETQLLTYLRLSGTKVDLIINFNLLVLKEGNKRLVF